MTPIPQFLLYSAVLIAVPLILLCVEVARLFFRNIGNFDRGRGWFNVGILFIVVVAMIYVTSVLELHRRRLGLLISPYPSARYAPERESFSGSDKWVYVAHDQADAVIDFYDQKSAGEGYALLVDKGTTTSRLLFSRNGEQLFLTIVDEGDARILYYSEEGDVRVVSR